MGNSAQEITAELAKLVEVREDVIVFAIVHSRSGLEMVSNTGDLVMKLGMLDVAKMTVMDIHAQMSMEMVEEGRKAVREAMAVMGNKAEQVN
jgi:hypothetical protein